MRNLKKLSIPTVLQENHVRWLSEYLEDKTSNTNKYRYRDKEIKKALMEETGWKCVYCESKVGHNTPGDIEHKIPSSKRDDLHFNWDNLTVACSECNRRKNDYYEESEGFLDPYIDDVENLIEHYGPVVGWVNGNERAEVTVKKLELDTYCRSQLISRKIEKIEELNNTVERYAKEKNPEIRKLVGIKIKRMLDRTSEYSGMILSIIKVKNLTIN